MFGNLGLGELAIIIAIMAVPLVMLGWLIVWLRGGQRRADALSERVAMLEREHQAAVQKETSR